MFAIWRAKSIVTIGSTLTATALCEQRRLVPLLIGLYISNFGPTGRGVRILCDKRIEPKDVYTGIVRQLLYPGDKTGVVYRIRVDNKCPLIRRCGH